MINYFCNNCIEIIVHCVVYRFQGQVKCAKCECIPTNTTVAVNELIYCHSGIRGDTFTFSTFNLTLKSVNNTMHDDFNAIVTKIIYHECPTIFNCMTPTPSALLSKNVVSAFQISCKILFL